MTKSFKYQSDSLAEIRKSDYAINLDIEVEICATAEDDAYASIDIHDPSTGESIDINILSPEERTEIEKRADAMASEFGYEAWHEEQIDRADALYDAWKDGDGRD